MEQVLNIFSQYKNPDGLLKSISHSFVFRVLGLLLIYVSQVLLARLMGPKAYGDYTVIITIVNIFRHYLEWIRVPVYSSALAKKNTVMYTVLSVSPTAGSLLFRSFAASLCLFSLAKQRSLISVSRKDYSGQCCFFLSLLLFIRRVLY
jgi:hypothetical protein